MAGEDVDISIGIDALSDIAFRVKALDNATGVPDAGIQAAYLKSLREAQPRIGKITDVSMLAALGVTNLRNNDQAAAYFWLGELSRHTEVTATSLRTARLAIARDGRGNLPQHKATYLDLQANLIKAELGLPDGFVAAEELLPILNAFRSEEAGTSRFQGGTGGAFFQYDFVRLMLHSFPRVVKLYTVDPNKPLGSGFFVKASDVLEGEDDRPVILTNHHVVHQKNKTVPLGQIRAECRYNPKLLIQRFSSILKESPAPMDYCILDPVIAAGTPDMFIVDEGFIPDPLGPDQASSAPRIIQFGYPARDGTVASNTAHRLIAKDASFVHYGANPMPGLSGGPVCDLNFNVFALHRGSGPIPSPLAPYKKPYSAGEGTRISAIRNH